MAYVVPLLVVWVVTRQCPGGRAVEVELTGGWLPPGNVRQLKNTLACALTFAEDGVLDATHLRLTPLETEESELDRLPLGGQALAPLRQDQEVRAVTLRPALLAALAP
jgi:DNA-binding NtrC family response regulator